MHPTKGGKSQSKWLVQHFADINLTRLNFMPGPVNTRQWRRVPFAARHHVADMALPAGHYQ